ncbi:MAG: sulfate adenylyltransferase subunit CysD [Candidatus Norongarragalinales archaeon]
MWGEKEMIEQDLKELEEKSVFVLREAKSRFKKVCMLWSTGKDSTTMVQLSRKAFFGKVPYPLVHLDNGLEFPEVYEFRDRLAREWNLNLIVEPMEIKQEDANISGISCCGVNKAEALKKLLDREGFEAVIVSIRRDEHGIRSKERYFSPRDKEFRWDYKNQPAEIWDFTSEIEGTSHVRVHPLLHWNEIDVWRFIKQEGIPVNPLYFARDGKRFRSLGCTKCTVSIASSAQTVDDIIEELRATDTAERAGRAMDKEQENVMQRLRALGYM